MFAPTIGAPRVSALGAFETCQRTLRMSVCWGRPEVVGAGPDRREGPGTDMVANLDLSAKAMPLHALSVQDRRSQCGGGLFLRSTRIIVPLNV